MKRKLILFFLLFPCLCSYGQGNTESLPTYFPKSSFGIRTNAVSWMMLMPNIGIEYKTDDHIGLLIDGGWAHWNLNARSRYWRMWNIAPQTRYYFGENKYNYIGAQYTMGEYNFTGQQGKYLGGGLTLGHQFYAGKNLMVDLGLSLGYLYLYDKEEYKRISGVNYRYRQKASNGYWGPTALSVSFVWKIN